MKFLNKQSLFDDLVDLVNDTICSSRSVSAFIAAQICLETGYCSSDIYKHANNLIGMRVPKLRVSLVMGEYKNHALYYTKYDCLYDYLIWLSCNGFNNHDMFDVNSFAAKLRKSSFNPSSKYVDTILTIYKTYYYE